MSATSLSTDDQPDQPIVVPAPHLPHPSAACRCDSESFGCPGGEDIVVVRVSGEVDLLTCPVLAAAMLEALRRGPGHLVIDLAATTFCCARGYEVIGETALDARSRGIGFALSGLTPHQGKVVTLMLPDLGPARHRSTASAVAAIRGGAGSARRRPGRPAAAALATRGHRTGRSPL